MSEVLGIRLEQLHSILKSQDASRHMQATTTVKDIFSFSLDVSESERGK